MWIGSAKGTDARTRFVSRGGKGRTEIVVGLDGYLREVRAGQGVKRHEAGERGDEEEVEHQDEG